MGIKLNPEDMPDLLGSVPGGILLVTSSPISVIGQLHDMAHYLAGDGFPGFLAWMNERYPDLQGFPPDAMQHNLQHLIDATHMFAGGDCNEAGKM